MTPCPHESIVDIPRDGWPVLVDQICLQCLHAWAVANADARDASSCPGNEAKVRASDRAQALVHPRFVLLARPVSPAIVPFTVCRLEPVLGVIPAGRAVRA